MTVTTTSISPVLEIQQAQSDRKENELEANTLSLETIRSCT